MVKQDDLKYFRFEGKGWPEQLFDLAVDPEEMYNLIDDPSYAADLRRLRAKVDTLLAPPLLNFPRGGRTAHRP